MSDLKPCPFCGGEVYIDRQDCYGCDDDYYLVHCDNCGLQFGFTSQFESKEEVTTAWNKRMPSHYVIGIDLASGKDMACISPPTKGGTGMSKQKLIDGNALLEKKFDICADGKCTEVVYAADVMFAPTVDAVPLKDVYRIIAGHSDYHGDAILAALTCISEGKEVKPIKPLDAVTPVHCKDCKWWTRNKDFSTQFGICGRFNAVTAKDGYCSAGRESEGGT